MRPFAVRLKSKSKDKIRSGTGHEVPGEELRYSSTISLTSALDGVGWLKLLPDRFTTRKEMRYPLYRRLGGPQRQSQWVRKTSPLSGIQTPDRPPRIESLYRLRYPSPRWQKLPGTDGYRVCFYLRRLLVLKLRVFGQPILIFLFNFMA